jgi:hypothetical protein
MAESKTKTIYTKTGGGNAAYCLGLIGALVYYVPAANDFWAVIVAILKAFVWPAFVVFDLLKFLHG